MIQIQCVFEHKQLYRSVYQDVPKDYYTLPLGKAALLKEGNLVTIIALEQQFIGL
jgi:2-oxoisovalerate dehydrogenase E1 component